ncbi:MAG: hypothetical protein RIB93_17870 [Coleofasciculus sp. D1-CHI-01]|uniref:hypothetical protein n=1 Tax=Coleofasciculus sp. D1-CHI-01 TaxID=3068482 RepID=UPI0032FCA605
MVEALTIKEAQQQIEGLIKENRLSSETIEALEKEINLLKQKTQEAVQAQQKAETEIKVAQQQIQDLQPQVAQLKELNTQLQSQVQRLSAQVKETPLQPLTPEEGSALLDRTFQAFRGIKNLRVVDADITLKLATGKLGDQSVLIFPQPGSVDSSTLHEIKFKLHSDDSLSQP